MLLILRDIFSSVADLTGRLHEVNNRYFGRG